MWGICEFLGSLCQQSLRLGLRLPAWAASGATSGNRAGDLKTDLRPNRLWTSKTRRGGRTLHRELEVETLLGLRSTFRSPGGHPEVFVTVLTVIPTLLWT